MIDRFAPLAVLLLAAHSLFAGSAIRDARPQIIDGTNVPASQFPTVGIVSDATGDFICSGTLIASRFVLTAAHCAVDGGTGAVNIGQTGGRFMLGGVTYKTAHVYANPTYHGDISQDQEGAIDLCVFELTQDVPNAIPSPLNRQAPAVGTQLTLVGYGEQGTGAKGSDGTLPKNGTVNMGTNHIDVLTPTFIKWNFDNVPAPNQESDTAPGDSGGPQFVAIDGVMAVASVTSGGSKANASFGDISYNTRVDIATAWIDAITGGVAVGGDTAPSIDSATFAPNPVTPGQQIAFAVAASDANGDALNYNWIFGDGTEDVNGSADETHTYASDGSYLVQLIVTDGKGGSVEKDIPVTVGSGQNAQPVIPSLIVKKRFTLNFALPAKSMLDFTVFNGAFVFTDKNAYLSAFDGATVSVYIGANKLDTLTLHGTRALGSGTLTFSYRNGNVRYQLRNNAQLVTLLASFGATNTTVTGGIAVPLRVEFNATRYGGNAQFSYTAMQNKVGTGR